MSEWIFYWPWAFWLLPLPLLILLLPRRGQTQSQALRVPFYAAVASQQTGSPAKNGLLRFLTIVAWGLLIVAAARPQWLDEPLTMPVSGRDMLLSVDISGSMDTRDMVLNGQQNTRLAAVKKVAGEFLTRRAGDKLGLILFGKRAYLQAPLTFDRETVRVLLNEAAIGLAGKETAIGDAIGLAVKRLREQENSNRVLILLTDGANTAGQVEPLRAADLAAAENIRVYTIGVGAEEMVVQGFFGNRTVNPSADLDEETLTAIAQKTGGQYFRARDTQQLEGIYALLDELEPVSEEQESYRPVHELFYWALLSALLLFALIFLIHARKGST